MLIYLTAFTTGVGSALRDTAAVTCIPRLADPASLDRANARVIAGQIVGNELAGPAAGGWLFGLAAVLPFAVNAGTLGIAVLLLLTLPAGAYQLLGRVTSLYGTVASGSEALGAVGGGAVAGIAGIRATMLIGAIPIAASMSLLAWQHRS